MKAALQYDMYFKPLSFVYQSDEIAKEIEDQLLIGNEIMIAPVYTQNAKRTLRVFARRNDDDKICI